MANLISLSWRLVASAAELLKYQPAVRQSDAELRVTLTT